MLWEIDNKLQSPLKAAEVLGLRAFTATGRINAMSKSEAKKVLHVDRNPYYGGASASLEIGQLFKKFGLETSPGARRARPVKRIASAHNRPLSMLPNPTRPKVCIRGLADTGSAAARSCPTLREQSVFYSYREAGIT